MAKSRSMRCSGSQPTRWLSFGKIPEPQGAAENGSLRTAPTAQVTPRVSRGEDTTSATQAAAGESTIPASQPAPVNQPSTATLLARVTRNALADSLSSYLRSQSTSPVAWQPWGADVFEIAEKLNRPVLLSIGVSWSDLVRSHDETVFGSSEVAALISEHFIAVKVDADERPEIAERYLSAHQLIHPENGEWPVIAFLLEDGRPFEECLGGALSCGDGSRNFCRHPATSRRSVLEQAGDACPASEPY